MTEAWWKKGIRFECQGTGRCCVNHGTASVVYVTRDDRRKLAQHFGLAQSVFTRRYCRRMDDRHVLVDASDGQACVFLEGKGCSVYQARPTQCRTWPFWPELLEDPERWQREVAGFCRGVGRGRTWTAEEIEKITAEQRAAEEQD